MFDKFIVFTFLCSTNMSVMNIYRNKLIRKMKSKYKLIQLLIEQLSDDNKMMHAQFNY